MTGSAAVLALGLVLVPQVACAQFFWDQPRLSADDAARAAIRRGFRVLARPILNDNVYVADVVDRRGAREQLVIAADTGQILQHYFVDMGRDRPAIDPSIPAGPVPPGRVPNDDNQPSLFSRLFGGGDDDNPRRAEPDRPFLAPDQSLARPLPRPRRPRVVEQEPQTIRPDSPIESAPLAPPTALPTMPHRAVAPPPLRHAPAEASLPPPAAPAAPLTAPPDHPGRSISTNPLAIPGSREQDEKTQAAVARKVPASAVPIIKTPAPAAPVRDAVPVAPLD